MELQEGQKAPDFEGVDQDGNTVKLANYKGKKVVIYFYPRDNTPGCTAQACNLRDNYEILQAQGYEIIGISGDSVKSHKKFQDKHELPFTLIADESKEIHNLFGTWGEKKMYGKTYMGTIRTTFIIDEEGNIAEIIKKVKTKDHTNQIIGTV